jgi:hypothetical protein
MHDCFYVIQLATGEFVDGVLARTDSLYTAYRWLRRENAQNYLNEMADSEKQGAQIRRARMVLEDEQRPGITWPWPGIYTNQSGRVRKVLATGTFPAPGQDPDEVQFIPFNKKGEVETFRCNRDDDGNVISVRWNRELGKNVPEITPTTQVTSIDAFRKWLRN